MFLDFTSSLAGTFAAFVLGAGLCTLVEFSFEAEKQSMMSRVRGLCFTFVSLAAALIATDLAQGAMHGAGLAPLFRLDLADAVHSPDPLMLVAAYTVIPMLSVMIYDVGYYCFHRLQHTVPFLWRYHAVHHSIEELNAFNAYHHVSEYFFRIPLLTLPINLLVWVGEPQVAITTLIISVVGKLSHANTRLSYGPLRYLFTEPRFHRIHHSIKEQHWNRNYAFYFPLLDVLFGTAYFPAKGEVPKTGIDYAREPRTLSEFLIPAKAPVPVRDEVVA